MVEWKGDVVIALFLWLTALTGEKTKEASGFLRLFLYFHKKIHMKKIYLLLFGLLPFFSNAQFANDSTNNVVIQDAIGSEQATPLISSRSDGGVYISWFDQSSGMYVLRIKTDTQIVNKRVEVLK